MVEEEIKAKYIIKDDIAVRIGSKSCDLRLNVKRRNTTLTKKQNKNYKTKTSQNSHWYFF